jgi:hypothetical protein
LNEKLFEQKTKDAFDEKIVSSASQVLQLLKQ